MQDNSSAPRFLRENQLIGGLKPRIPIAHSTLWRWVSEGYFPKPISLGPRVTAWPIESVIAWETERLQRGGL
jgi:prophage regulatory protein